MTVSEISTDANGNVTVTWSKSLNGTPAAGKSTDDVAFVRCGTPSHGRTTSFILGEVTYAYTPNLGYAISGTCARMHRAPDHPAFRDIKYRLTP